MSRRTQVLFLLLVAAQAMHSVEEYVTGLYATFAPAQFVSGLISDDRALGFATLNSVFVAFGFWCYFLPVRRRWAAARVFAWSWTIVELANGTGHIALALYAGRYFSGVVTAPLLLATAVCLAMSLNRDNRSV